MTKSRKIVTAALVVVGLAAVTAVWLWQRQSEGASLREALGRAFNRPAQLIELNLPPAAGRYPGAVMLTPQPGQTLPMRRAFRPDQIPEFTTSLRVSIQAEAKAELFSSFIGNTASTGDLALVIRLDDLRLFEADLNENFKKTLLEDEDVYRANKRGLMPRVIVRAYEAVLSFHVRRAGSLSAEAWQTAQDELLKAGGRFADARTIEFKGEHPTVIAYETVTVDYVATSLSARMSRRVELSDARSVNAVNGPLDISAFKLTPGAGVVRHVSMGNARYESDSFGNLRVVEPSLQIVESVFEQVGAEPLLSDHLPRVLNESKMNDVLSQIVDKLRVQVPSLFVLYYAGHAVAGRGGQLYLVMSNYRGDPAKDLGEDSLLGLPRALLNEPTSPLQGSNIGDLLDVVNALQAEAPSEVKGLFPVSEIASRLQDTGTPFVILIDACYEHGQMDRLRDAANLTQSGDYYGPDLYGRPQNLRRYADAIHQFGAAPYLNSTNVVIFSSTPGSIAMEVEDPRPGWGPTRYVAPLARRIHSRLEAAVARSKAVTWGDFLETIVDVKRLGEVRIHGTISWSDFNVVRQLPMLRESS